jgi:hypothetical protein
MTNEINKPVITLADTRGAVYSFAVSNDYLMRVFDSLHKYGEPLPAFTMPDKPASTPARTPASYGAPGYMRPDNKPASTPDKPANKPAPGNDSGGGIKPAPVTPAPVDNSGGGATFADSLNSLLKTI